MRRIGLSAFAVLALVTCAAALAEAGVQNVPCRNPFVFPEAAVNVVVLPYQSAPGLPVSIAGEDLARLLQFEVLRSIAKFGRVGAVQMAGTPDDCAPDLVIRKLLGQTPGASQKLRKGQGLIVVWGRFYTQGGAVLVQTFCRLLRAGVEETLDLVAGGQRFSGALSAQAFACAPRKVTNEDLMNFARQFARSTVVRSTPDESAAGAAFPDRPVPYWISDIQGDWMKVGSRGGPEGWIRLSGARDPWSLTRWLPELSYIEGMAGYLRYRIAREQSIAAGTAWIEDATRALSEYERTLEVQPSAPDGPIASPWRTALALAAEFQLRGVLSEMKPGATVEDRVNATKLFERASTMLPQDANARNLVAMMHLSLAFDGSDPGLSPKDAADDLRQALGADPANARLLANLQSAYQALLDRPGAATTLTEDQRREVSEQLAAIRQIRNRRQR